MPEETSAPPRPRRRRQRIALIGGGVVAAMAAAVAAIALTASPANPYAAPRSICALVSPATVAKYVSADVHGKSVSGTCSWSVRDKGGLDVYANVLDDAAQARTGFPEMIQRTEKANTTPETTVTGTRVMTGLGDQATAVFETSTTTVAAGKRAGLVFLFVRSRNAIIEIVRGSGAREVVLGPALLPGAIAIAREVMAAMPTLGPGSPGVGVHISLDVSHPAGGVVIFGEPGRGDQHRGIAE